MPGPFQVSTAAHPLANRGGPQGPWEYGGTLYCFAFSDLTTLEAYSSSDAGETWTATGETRTIGGTTQVFAACRSIAGDYVYVLYVVPDGFDTQLEVSRFNLATGAVDDTSAAGPTLDNGAGNAALLFIEESTDGGFGVLVKTFPGSGSTIKAEICTLSADLNSWSSLSAPAGQTDSDHLFNPVGIARGLDGRIHGFVRKQTISTDEHSLLHVLVIGEGGGIGTAFDEIEAEIDDEDLPISAAALADGTIGVIYNAPDVGVGTNWKLRSAIATSADAPSWAFADIDTSAAADAGVNAGLVGGSAFRAAWAAGGTIYASTYSSGWSASTALLSSIGGAFSGREVGSAWGFFFTDFSDDPLPSFYFLASGAAQTITGVEPITTKERFFNTSGVTGGGLDTCGTPIAVEPSNACNPVDPDTAIDAPGECVPQGYSF
ncbi:MAG: hypothetical protein IPK75_18280 [Acidobacteria bacterium]|nr:hypothetical protein [Acidobacteriota bacterium]